MAQLIVRNIKDSVKEALRAQAALHGRSMEEEAREILNAGVTPLAPRKGLGTRIREMVGDQGFDFDIPELRGEVLKPVDFSGKEFGDE